MSIFNREPKVRSGKADIHEMELWPDLTWRLSALLRAGLHPQRVFHTLLHEAQHRSDETTQNRWVRFVESRSTQARAQKLALADITALLEQCAQAAHQGLPLSTVIAQVPAQRYYSEQKKMELAACWRIGEETGAPLAQSLERLARFYENEIDLYQARESAMSGPKTTGSILSWLPLLGLGLGMLMGTNPLGILFGSIPGALAALVGLALALLGRRWTARLVQAAERGESS